MIHLHPWTRLKLVVNSIMLKHNYKFVPTLGALDGGLGALDSRAVWTGVIFSGKMRRLAGIINCISCCIWEVKWIMRAFWTSIWRLIE